MKNLSGAIYDLACIGKVHLDQVKSLNYVRGSNRVFALTCMLDDYYASLEKIEFEIWKLPIEKLNPLYLQWNMWLYTRK